MGRVQSIQLAAFLPFVMNAKKKCTELPPCPEFFALATNLSDTEWIILFSILQGYTYADFEEMGTAILAVNDKTSVIVEEVLIEFFNYH